jgi:hypothetical protein
VGCGSMDCIELVQDRESLFVNMVYKYLKDSTTFSCFWSVISFTGNGCLEILIAFVFSQMNVEKKFSYLYCPHRCAISKFNSYTLSNTTRQILPRTHYIGDIFRLTL